MRLPYNLKGFAPDIIKKPITLVGMEFADNLVMLRCKYDGDHFINVPVQYFRPYLKPMSMLTSELEDDFYADEWFGLLLDRIDGNLTKVQDHMKLVRSNYLANRFLVSRHFDVNNLIGLGMALPVSEFFNPYEN